MGPLQGITIVELAGIGPGPFCGMLLSDLGADVVHVARPARTGALPDPITAVAGRGRRSIVLDLKNRHGVEVLLRLLEHADVFVEGFRPGVVERLGIEPDVVAERNPRLVYARMTGWGREGPYATMAGHDIDYIALTGALHAIGPAGGPPVPPLNLVGDYGGGALYLAVGILAALVERQRSGRGQVVDAAMVDGAASLMSVFFQLHAVGYWRDERGVNLLDGGAPFYTTYETADGRYVAVGAIEPQFYRELLEGLGLADETLPDQLDQEGWPELRRRFAAAFRTRTRDEWEERFAGTDACVAPVLTLEEAPHHPHNRARRTFLEHHGRFLPAPAPRFGRSRTVPGREPSGAGSQTIEVLEEIGLAGDEIDAFRRLGAFG